MGYHDTVMRKKHDPGEYIKSINFEKKVFEEINSEHFVSGLSKYLAKSQSVSGKPSGEITRKRAKMLAEKVFEGQISDTPFDKTQAIEEVVGAIEEGYIRYFKLEEPWHPAIYYDEKRLTTIPWQHKKTVSYSGRQEYEFYSKEYLKKDERWIENFRRAIGDPSFGPEDLHNFESVLKTGYIKPGNRYEDDKEKGKKLNPDTNIWALYTTIEIAKAKDFAGHNAFQRFECSEPVLEVETPSRFLSMPSASGGKTVFINGVEDYFEYFSAPKEFDTAFQTGTSEFVYIGEEGPSDSPVMPLNYINGVWDLQETNHPYFVPLKSYIKKLYSEIPEKLPPQEKVKIDVGAQKGEFRRKKNLEAENKKLYNFLNKDNVSIQNILKPLHMASTKVFELETGRDYLSRNYEADDRTNNFRTLVGLLSRCALRKNGAVRGANEIDFNFNFDQSREISDILLSERPEKLEEWEEKVSEEEKLFKKSAQNQKIKGFEDSSELVSQLEEDIKKALSIEITEDCYFKLAKNLANGKKELEKFRQIIEDENPKIA